MIQLDMRMPNSCGECQFLYVDNDDTYICVPRNAEVPKDGINEDKPDKCPLMYADEHSLFSSALEFLGDNKPSELLKVIESALRIRGR